MNAHPDTEHAVRLLAREGRLRYEVARAIFEALPADRQRELAFGVRTLGGSLDSARREAKLTSASIFRAIRTGGR